MGYNRNIEIYKLKENFKSPLASSPEKCADHGMGDPIIIIDDEVWILDWNNLPTEQYAKAIYSPTFVRMNNNIFEKQ